MPFREAHRKAGEAVKLAESRSVALPDLSMQDFKIIATEFDADVKDVFDFAKSVASRNVIGGTSPNAVQEQIEKAKKIVSVA
jgi:argininosuccinate lyase